MKRCFIKKRWFSSLVAAGYLFVIAAAPLFHNRAAHCGDCDVPRHVCDAAEHDPLSCPDDHPSGNDPDRHSPERSSPQPFGDNHCSVCHFLAQKPAPVAEVAVQNGGTLIEEAVLPSPMIAAAGVFSAWQSRAPPCFA